MSELLFKEESYRILGACFEVYNRRGFGFTEPIYHECLAIEFEQAGIPFVSQPHLELQYRGRMLKQHFVPDFICFDKIIIELKSVNRLVKEHVSQTLNYLYATGFELAWLINFGQIGGLERKRLVNSRNNSLSDLRKVYSELAKDLEQSESDS